MQKKRHLWDEYRFPGFHPREGVQGIFGDPGARVIVLKRRQKKQPVVPAARYIKASTIGRFVESGTFPAAPRGSTWKWRFGESPAGGAGQ